MLGFDNPGFKEKPIFPIFNFEIIKKLFSHNSDFPNNRLSCAESVKGTTILTLKDQSNKITHMLLLYKGNLSLTTITRWCGQLDHDIS
jgi:hypothetical protein